MAPKRYFDEGSRLKPGVISDELRKALGIHDDKLPVWIYRMRVLGYPPGWYQQAKVNTLAIFDGSKEDGELNEGLDNTVQEFNKDSFIEYPGFNCPVPQGIRDDWYYLGMPPMLPNMQLREALKTMKVSEPVPYKKRKVDLSSSNASPSTSGASTPQTSTKPPPFESVHTSHNTSTPLKSPTNDKLSEHSDSVIELDSSMEDNFKTPLKESDEQNESANSERKLKLIAMGSPMPASERPKRPPLEKWGIGMGELIYFENLPEYTGVYENKMKGLINKIRKHNQT